MRVSRRTARTLLAACLLVFQAQVFAASVLGCEHGPVAPGGDAAPVFCPYHQAGGTPVDDPAPDSTLGCQKCALHCALGIQGPAALAAEPLDTPRQGHVTGAPGWFVASATLDTLLRPPNALLL